jgi:uncharacterized protein YxeA
MIKKILLLLLLLLLIAGGAFYFINAKDTYDASKYSASSTKMAPEGEIDFTLPDQFGKTHTLSNDTRSLVFTFAKDTSHKVRDFLKSQPADFLSAQNALYIADISPMPTVIRNAFAMPDLKKSAYPVLLMYDGEIAKKFKDEKQKEAIMIVKLNNKKITEVLFVNEAAALTGLLK